MTSPGTTNYYGIAGRMFRSIVHPARTVLIAEIPAYDPYSWHAPKLPLAINNATFNKAKDVIGFVDGHVGYTTMYYRGEKVAWSYEPPAGYDYQWGGN